MKGTRRRVSRSSEGGHVWRGDGAGNTGSPLHRLTRQPVFQFRTPHLTPTGVRGHSKGHYFRRSRQNGWLGTCVRESQMTCVRVRVTTSSEVVHRRHRDEKEHKGATKRKRNEMIFWERAGRNRLISPRFDFGCVTWDRRAPFAFTCV